MKKIVFLLVPILLVCCSRKEISADEEKLILESTLPTVLDSIRFSVLSAPYIDSLKNQYAKGKMLIIIKDSTEILSSEDQVRFLKNYKDASMDIDSSYQTKTSSGLVKIKNRNPHKLALTLSDKKYDFRLASQFREKGLNAKEKVYCGELALSSVRLDDSKSKGLFSVSYSCCYQYDCGNGWVVLVTKTNGKWKVDKVIPTWIN